MPNPSPRPKSSPAGRVVPIRPGQVRGAAAAAQAAAVGHVPPIDVPVVDWDAFRRRFRWQPGEHTILIGPTGRGKSTLAGLLLKRRKYAVALDLKGDDPTLKGWGWEVIEDWPVPDEGQRLEGRVVEQDGRKVRVVDPIRVRLAPPVLTPEQIADAGDVFEDCLADIFGIGRWCVYVDELLIATDRNLYGLADHIHRLMVFGRSRGATIVAATQAPKHIPKSTYQQTVHQFHWPIRDEQEFIRQAEITGLGRTNLRQVFRSMKKHQFLYVKAPDTYMISQAPPPDAEPIRQTRTLPADVPRPQAGDRVPRRASKVRRLAWGR